MNEYLEIRSAAIDGVSDSRTITGYAIVFNSESEDLGFIEVIKPESVTQDTINNSDVFCRFNHNEEKVLARSKYGKGSLTLDIDDHGLKYTFEAPNTELGDELIEYIKRGDIESSSFAFAVSPDSGSETWYKSEDGTIYREINKIDYLADVSPVWTPAYSATTVSNRALELAKSLSENEIQKITETRGINDDEKKSPENNTVGITQNEELLMRGTKDVPVEDIPVACDDPIIVQKDPTIEENPEEDQIIEDDLEEEKSCGNANEKQKRNMEFIDSTPNNQKKTNNTMKSEFRLISAIRAIAENRSLDDVALAVKEAGVEEMRKAGVSASGQIILPVEQRSISVASDGADVVATNLYDIIEPLRAKSVLVQAGANFISGLSSNVQLPVMAGSNVGWAGEISEAADGGASFSNFILSPKRLTAYVDLSKMLLVQDSIGVENMIRQDLINAITEKLESTILGSVAGSATQPAGMFYGVTPTVVSDFAGIVALEQAVEQANVLNPINYVASPKARANFRNMQKGTKNNTQLAYSAGELDGTPVFSTSNVVSGNFIVGDFSNLAIGQFGALDIVVDPYTKSTSGQIRLVINAYFDAKVIRSAAFAYGTFNAA